MCREDVAPSDAILVENFDPNYLVFERAAALQKAGFSGRVLVPTGASEHAHEVAVSRGTAELMARVARLENIEIIPIQEIEPISLNAAYQIRDFLMKEHLRSVIVVALGFRSKRSSLVYRAVLTPAGIRAHCMPVVGAHAAENWTATGHGIENVIAQLIKLEYYQFYVLPLARRSRVPPPRMERVPISARVVASQRK